MTYATVAWLAVGHFLTCIIVCHLIDGYQWAPRLRRCRLERVAVESLKVMSGLGGGAGALCTFGLHFINVSVQQRPKVHKQRYRWREIYIHMCMCKWLCGGISKNERNLVVGWVSNLATLSVERKRELNKNKIEDENNKDSEGRRLWEREKSVKKQRKRKSAKER